jgi:hypothetical protein
VCDVNVLSTSATADEAIALLDAGAAHVVLPVTAPVEVCVRNRAFSSS